MDTYIELLKIILPEFLIDNFDFVKTDKNNEIMHLYFEERKILPQEESHRLLILHGFYDEVTIQDFPLRGNAVYLHVKRRRWLDKDTKEIIKKDWNLVAKGTRLTPEFACFLKEINRSKASDCHTIGGFFNIDGKKLQRQYKESLSDFNSWSQKEHAENYLLFPQNIGSYLSIDETALSKGELYTIITNKCSKGKKGSIVAIFSGTKVEPIIEKLKSIPIKLRNKVKEVTLDMANSMKNIINKAFPSAIQVTDRFHVQKLATEALQSIRIEYRWEALKQEHKAIEVAKKSKEKFKEVTFENGDTRKELLARSRYVLYKATTKWTPNQQARAEILFKEYPLLKKTYHIVNELRNIYNSTIYPATALTKLAHWYREVEELNLSNFNTVINTIKNNSQS